MLVPPTRRFGLAVLVCFLLFAPGAWAQDAETRARELNRDAMDEDYPATNFKSALAKLEKALASCGKDKCSNELVAKIHGNIGTVHAAGLAQHAQAVAAFKEMLRLDPSQTPNSAYLTGDVQKAFDEAKATLTGAGVTGAQGRRAGGKPAGAGHVSSGAVYVDCRKARRRRVIVRYRPPGRPIGKELVLQKHEKGLGRLFRARPSRKGALFTHDAFDQNLDRIASAGSEQPRKVDIKPAIGGRQLALPQRCRRRLPTSEERLSCETTIVRASRFAGIRAALTRRCGDPKTARRRSASRTGSRSGFARSRAGSPRPTRAARRRRGRQVFLLFRGWQFTDVPIQSGPRAFLSGGVGTGSMRVLVATIACSVSASRRVFASASPSGYPEREDGKKLHAVPPKRRRPYHLRGSAEKGCVRICSPVAAGQVATRLY
jgi:hypothetical protein